MNPLPRLSGRESRGLRRVSRGGGGGASIRTRGARTRRAPWSDRVRWLGARTLGMELTVLGSGSAMPVPDRVQAGYLLDDGDRSLVVDWQRRPPAAGRHRDRLRGSLDRSLDASPPRPRRGAAPTDEGPMARRRGASGGRRPGRNQIAAARRAARRSRVPRRADRSGGPRGVGGPALRGGRVRRDRPRDAPLDGRVRLPVLAAERRFRPPANGPLTLSGTRRRSRAWRRSPTGATCWSTTARSRTGPTCRTPEPTQLGSRSRAPISTRCCSRTCTRTPGSRARDGTKRPGRGVRRRRRGRQRRAPGRDRRAIRVRG